MKKIFVCCFVFYFKNNFKKIEKYLKSDESIIGVYENLNLNYHEENPTSTNLSNYLLENIHAKKTKFPLMFVVRNNF